jgi:hypothetical protein
MSEPDPHQLDEGMADLLIKQVTEGLSPAEQRALDVLDDATASRYRRDFERAAAAVALAGSAPAEPLPPALRERLDETARTFFAAAPVKTIAPDNVVAFDSRPAPATATTAAHPPSAAAPVSATSGAYGWFAAAACLVLAVFGWVRSPSPAPPVAQSIAPPASIAPEPAQLPPSSVSPPSPAASPAEERAALLAQASSLKVKMAATKDPGGTGASGDVVWDPKTQRGYLHFVGLAANDPAVHQYQLWIFDGARDQRYPVDGGVFDIPANAHEIIVPIHAALAVVKAAAFAVTVERPGGVVVSGREHIVVLGTVG